jgi:hypothetical protein
LLISRMVSDSGEFGTVIKIAPLTAESLCGLPHYKLDIHPYRPKLDAGVEQHLQ